MKHNVQQPRSTILRENHEAMPPASPNPSSTTKQQQKCLTPPPYRKNKSSSSKENANPNSDLNSSPAVVCGLLKMKSPLPPRHPNSNPLKRKLSVESENGAAVAAGSSDSGVKVISRKLIVLTLLKM